MNNRISAYLPKSLQAVIEPREVQTLKTYPGLNTAKGILILLVLFAHALPGGIIQFFNYFFEMPLFMAISGFLLKEKNFQGSLRKYSFHILKRLLIPWSIAFIIYLPLQLQHQSFTVSHLLYPFYHLWFIPAYCLGAIICCIIVRFRLPVLPFVLVAATFTFVWYIIFRDSPLPLEKQSLYWIGDKRFYAYQFFFIVGFSLRNKLINFKVSALPFLFIIITSFILICIFVEMASPVEFIAVPYMFFNFSLIIYVLYFYAPMSFLRNKVLDYINKNSLGIYLFHPLIMMGIYRFIGDPDKTSTSQLGGLAVALATLVLVIIVVWLIQRLPFTNKYMLGNAAPKAVASGKIEILFSD